MACFSDFKRPFLVVITIASMSFGIMFPFCRASCCVADKCRKIWFNEVLPDKAIMGHLIRTVLSPDRGSCQVKCYSEPNCVSINVGPLQEGSHKCELNNATAKNQASSILQTRKDYTYLGIENPCSSSPCINNGICQVGYTAKGFRCKCAPGLTGPHCGQACSFDFEKGIGGWQKTGTAFNNQPTFGDNPTARNRKPANQQGDWWIGGAENRPSEEAEAGNGQGDGPQGTLTSPCFRIFGNNISFLIGGGCDVNVVRAELIVNNQVVRNETGNCWETMYRKSWDVQEYIGQHACVRLVDDSSGGWGHINFDDLKGNIVCSQD
ncbi:hypothetical protein ACROYT_G022098 [Oculina patagonica]